VSAEPRSVRTQAGLLVATFGGIGYAPVAPGTFGSAAGLVVYWLLRDASPLLFVAVTAILLLGGIWGASLAEQELGTDPGPVVIDEVVGMLITLAFIDVTLAGAILGFFVFRLLDVVKPWPAGRFERLHGGLGVMADDVMAAIYGNIVMRLLIWLVPAGWLA
jgi:phosphatidylglycerophosphatase A